MRELQCLPGIGPRSAERIALWLLQSRNANPLRLARSLHDAQQLLKNCNLCGFFTTDDLCQICTNPERKKHPLCVVETVHDVIAIERTGIFQGSYHILGGKLSPLDGVSPDQLRIVPLLERLKTEHPPELILALSADVEGEATTHYLTQLLAQTGILVSRIAHGLPAGGGLEHADEITLSKALAGRHEL
jgi:recombination protein RecR